MTHRTSTEEEEDRPRNEQIVQTECKLCGGPLDVTIPAEASWLHGAVRRLVPMATHDRCYDKRREELRSAELVAAQLARSKEWETLCPPEFRKRLDWTKRNADRRKYERVMDWRFGEQGLLIVGTSQQCKTRFMFKLLEREFNGGKKVAALTHAEMRRKLSSLEIQAAVKLVTFWVKLDLLFIDDLGGGMVTRMSEEAFEDVLCGRGSNGRPTMFTTNLSMDRLANRFSEDRSQAIMRRLLENCAQLDFDALGKKEGKR
jgi:hypothetical protein